MRAAQMRVCPCDGSCMFGGEMSTIHRPCALRLDKHHSRIVSSRVSPVKWLIRCIGGLANAVETDMGRCNPAKRSFAKFCQDGSGCPHRCGADRRSDGAERAGLIRIKRAATKGDKWRQQLARALHLDLYFTADDGRFGARIRALT